MGIRLQWPVVGGGDDEALISADRAQLVQSLHGKHYEDCLAGRVFSHVPTVLGLAIPIYTATALAGGMPIWNPAGSGVNVELISASTAYVSGTSAYGGVVLMHRAGLGTDLATGSEITAFAETTPDNGLLGAGNSSKVKSSNAGTTTVTAGVAGESVRTLFSLNLEAATGTAHQTSVAEVDFEGTVIVPPGSMVWLGCRVASSALFTSGFVWKELAI